MNKWNGIFVVSILIVAGWFIKEHFGYRFSGEFAHLELFFEWVATISLFLAIISFLIMVFLAFKSPKKRKGGIR